MVDTVMVFDSILDRGAAVNLPWEEGNQYLVINISFKNTDNESKMVPDGTLEIDRGNYELKYDSPETLVQRGWGSLLQDIEPGITKKTRIVYKIPSSTTGKVYYYPDAANNGDRIFLLQL
jgi:hypothetical protein